MAKGATVVPGHRQPVHIHLEKHLPVASGIGGGSSDAAATLKLLARRWSPGMSEADLIRIAAPLGADLPMCVAARPLIARGIGDELQPVPALPPLDLVLANPGVEVATPAVFRRLASKTNPPLGPLPGGQDHAAIVAWLAAQRNDLQAPAIDTAPEISACLAALAGAGADLARMSGSGATCFGIFPDAAAASLAAARLKRQHPGWFVAATQTASAGSTT